MRWIVATLALAAPAAAQDVILFQSPSRNIHCMIFQGDGDWQGVRCDVLEMTGVSYPVPPADCDLDWGHGFEVGRTGPGAPVCAGDTVASPDGPVLGYGQTVSGGGVTCISEQTGMTCTNRQGHGFTVAKARQRVF